MAEGSPPPRPVPLIAAGATARQLVDAVGCATESTHVFPRRNGWAVAAAFVRLRGLKYRSNTNSTSGVVPFLVCDLDSPAFCMFV